MKEGRGGSEVPMVFARGGFAVSGILRRFVLWSGGLS